jgi:D-glycero-D-manno-heptose 1,7-bisphosphate phosphatase
MNPPRPAVFLDRDNTLIEDPGYLRDASGVRLLNGAGQAVSRLRAAGYPVIVVTNQSGIARGLITEDDVAAIHQRMQELLASAGAHVDAIYYCPYLNGEEAVRPEYRVESDLRKPKPGMLLLAAREHAIDLSRSWMIGDSQRDVQAGRAAGCRTILLSAHANSDGAMADLVAPDLMAAVNQILGVRPEADAGRSNSTTPITNAADEPTLQHIIDELRLLRRERQFGEFSLGHLAGAVFQAFALCAIGWGLYAAVNGAGESAVIRLLAGIAFQLIALTWLSTAGKR